MANKILQIGQKTLRSENKPTYVDLNMTSKYYSKEEKPDWNDYYCYLVQEGYTPDELYNIITEETRDNEKFPKSAKDNLYLCYTKTGNYASALDLWLRKSKYRIDESDDVNAVMNSLRNIFSWEKGERILDPEFGNELKKYLYQGINQTTEEQIVAEIKSCIAKYEPRVENIQVINASTLSDTDDNTIVLDIQFGIKGLKNRLFTYRYEYYRTQ